MTNAEGLAFFCQNSSGNLQLTPLGFVDDKLTSGIKAMIDQQLMNVPHVAYFLIELRNRQRWNLPAQAIWSYLVQPICLSGRFH